MSKHATLFGLGSILVLRSQASPPSFRAGAPGPNFLQGAARAFVLVRFSQTLSWNRHCDRLWLGSIVSVPGFPRLAQGWPRPFLAACSCSGCSFSGSPTASPPLATAYSRRSTVPVLALEMHVEQEKPPPAVACVVSLFSHGSWLFSLFSKGHSFGRYNLEYLNKHRSGGGLPP